MIGLSITIELSYKCNRYGFFNTSRNPLNIYWFQQFYGVWYHRLTLLCHRQQIKIFTQNELVGSLNKSPKLILTIQFQQHGTWPRKCSWPWPSLVSCLHWCSFCSTCSCPVATEIEQPCLRSSASAILQVINGQRSWLNKKLFVEKCMEASDCKCVFLVVVRLKAADIYETTSKTGCP